MTKFFNGELDEYKYLGVVKTMLARQDLISLKLLKKLEKKVGMLLNGCIDGRKTNPTTVFLLLNAAAFI